MSGTVYSKRSWYDFDKVICIKNFYNNKEHYKEGDIYFVSEYYGVEFYIYNSTQKPPIVLYSLHCDYRKNFVTEKEYRKLKLEKLNEI